MRTSLVAAIAAALTACAGAAVAQDAKSPPLAVGACAGCHGQNGEGMGSTPKIVGYAKADLAAILQSFKKDERKPSSIMNRIAKGYSDADVEAIAGWFAALPQKKK